MAPKHWTHDRPYFYKYMTADTAKIVLRNGTLRWSSPTLFNDPFDVQFDLHIEYDRDKAAERAMQATLDAIAGRISPKSGNILGQMHSLVRLVAPNISEKELRDTLMPAIYQGMERSEQRLPATQSEMRAIIADLKLLCLSEVNDNILMWSHYCKDHTGVVLQLRCIEEKDSAWGAAKPVRYTEVMPLLVDEEKFVSLMSGEDTIAGPHVFENAVFVKAQDWAYEKEWRLVGGRDSSERTEDVPFWAEEISAIYLGCRMSPDNVKAILDIASNKYPHAAVYIGHKSERRFAIEFNRI